PRRGNPGLIWSVCYERSAHNLIRDQTCPNVSWVSTRRFQHCGALTIGHGEKKFQAILFSGFSRRGEKLGGWRVPARGGLSAWLLGRASDLAAARAEGRKERPCRPEYAVCMPGACGRLRGE